MIETLLERYVNGAEMQVWSEIIKLEDKINDSNHKEDVLKVIGVMMERIKYNLGLIHQELLNHDYQFSDYEQLNHYGYEEGIPINYRVSTLEMSKKVDIMTKNFESFGKLPLIVAEWYKNIDIVDFRGYFPALRSSVLLDPLFVHPLEAIVNTSILDYDNLEESYYLCFSPDQYGKEGISGGGGYGLYLKENVVADSLVVNFSNELTLVDYLRKAFKCGGFLGLNSLIIKNKNKPNYFVVGSDIKKHELIDNKIIEIAEFIASKTLMI
ncbi:MAG: hypothetical protein H7Y04_09885 [Verrucomicrobia bacterium]|nr:hypothetical protein [Cytophagales bacterium]